MTRGRASERDARVDARMEAVEPMLASVTGVAGELLRDELRDYFDVCERLIEVRALVDAEGYTIESNRGNVVKNPNVGTMHSMLCEKNGMLPKLLKCLRDEGVGDSDPLMDYLRG